MSIDALCIGHAAWHLTMAVDGYGMPQGIATEDALKPATVTAGLPVRSVGGRPSVPERS